MNKEYEKTIEKFKRDYMRASSDCLGQVSYPPSLAGILFIIMVKMQELEEKIEKLEVWLNDESVK